MGVKKSFAGLAVEKGFWGVEKEVRFFGFKLRSGRFGKFCLSFYFFEGQ